MHIRLYICLILKGLYDPARLRRVCMNGIGEPIEIEGRAVFNAEDTAVCLVDEHTAIVSFGPGREPRHMERVIQGMVSRENTPLPAHAAPAFDLITLHQSRMAASGAFTDAQKAMIEEELTQELARLEETPRQRQGAQMELEALRIALALAKVDLFTGYWAFDGKLTLSATCPDADAAASLATPLTKTEELLRTQILASVVNVPEPFKALFQDVAGAAKLWEVTASNAEVTLHADTGMLSTLAIAAVGWHVARMPPLSQMVPVEPETEEPAPVAPELR